MTAPPPSDKVDFIPRVKVLTGQLQDCLNNTTRTAAQAILMGNLIDSGSLTKVEPLPNSPRFDKYIEEFFGLCDQIEHYLKTAIDSYQQGASSARYLTNPVIPTRVEPGPIPEGPGNAISYPQYLHNVRSQISYLKEIHDTLLSVRE